MKNLMTIFFSVALSTALIGTLFYFNLLPHMETTSSKQKEATQIDETEKNNEENAGLLDEAGDMINNVVKKVDTESACRKAGEIMKQIEDQCGSMPFPGVEKCIQMRIERSEVELKEENLARAKKMEALNKEYLVLSTNCK